MSHKARRLVFSPVFATGQDPRQPDWKEAANPRKGDFRDRRAAKRL